MYLRYLVSTVLFLPVASSAAAANSFQELALSVAKLIDTATFTLIILALVVYFWGVATNIPNFGDEKGAEKRKAMFFWGIIILFVMVSIWGIVRLIQATLFTGQYDPTQGPAQGSGGAFDTFNGTWEAE